MTDEPTPLERLTKLMEAPGPKYLLSREQIIEEAKRHRRTFSRLLDQGLVVQVEHGEPGAIGFMRADDGHWVFTEAAE